MNHEQEQLIVKAQDSLKAARILANATEEEALEQICRAEQFVDLAKAFFDQKK